jgi:hypothetical protein
LGIEPRGFETNEHIDITRAIAQRGRIAYLTHSLAPSVNGCHSAPLVLARSHLDVEGELVSDIAIETTASERVENARES